MGGYVHLILCSARDRIQPDHNIWRADTKQSTSGSRDKDWESGRWGELPIEVLFGAKLCVHQCRTWNRGKAQLRVKQRRWWEIPSHSALEKKWGYTHYNVEVCLAAVLLTSYFFLVSSDYCDDGGKNDDANDDDDDDNDDCEYCFEIRKVPS